MKYLITIIIPTYNCEKTIGDALDSILGQSIKEVEVLIVDGLSTDRTLEIVAQYQTKHANIVLHSENDEGIYDAMNKGIGMAKGDWLYFMGSDDMLFENDTLKKIEINLRKTDARIIYGNVFSTRFNGIYDGEFNCSKLAKKNICHQAIFFHTSIFKKIGIFNLKYKAHADWDHNIRCFCSAKVKNKFVNITVANYADGGFSSVHGDPIFAKEKNILLVKKGFGTLKTQEWLKYYSHALKECISDGRYFTILNLLALKFLIKLKRLIKNE